MKSRTPQIFLVCLLLTLCCRAGAQVPKSGDSLSAEILRMDSVLFTAFNTHDSATLQRVFDKDLEFYHDKGGLTNYRQNMDALGGLFSRTPDLRRQLLAGSTEVYPVKDYGAIQTGVHRFCHKEAGKDDCGNFKFLHIWKRTAEGWKLARVVSYDH